MSIRSSGNYRDSKDPLKDIISIMKASRGSDKKKIGITSNVSDQDGYFYDSIDQVVCDQSFYVIAGAIFVEIYPLCDPDSSFSRVIEKNSWLMEQTIQALKEINFGVRIKVEDSYVKIYRFDFNSFIAEAEKREGLLLDIMSQGVKLLADWLGTAYMLSYNPKRQCPDPINKNLNISVLLGEYLSRSVVLDDGSGWATFYISEKEASERTKIPIKSINNYRALLAETGVLDLSTRMQDKIDVKRAFKIVEGKPKISIKTSQTLKKLYEEVFYGA